MVATGLAISVGCNEPEAPTVSASSTTPAPTPTAPIKGPSPQVLEPTVPTLSLRLAVRPPKGIRSDDRSKLVSLAPTVTINGESIPVASKPKTLRDAREGIAILLVIGGGDIPLHCQGARALLKALGPRDRVAVGTIMHQGFQLIAGFSADTQGAESALNLLERAANSSEKTHLLPTYQALITAAQTFHGRSLPALRAVVLAHEAEHDQPLRATQMARQTTLIQRLFNRENVRLYTVVAKDTEQNGALWQHLSQSTGGGFVAIPKDDGDVFKDRIGDTFREVNHTLRRRVVVSVDMPKTMDTQGHIDIEVAFPTQTPADNQRRMVASLDKQGVVSVVDMNIPPSLPPPLPPGVTTERDLKNEARRAEEQKENLRSGVLWMLAHQADPTDLEAKRNTDIALSKLQKPQNSLGEIQVGSNRVLVDLPVEINLQLVEEILKQWMGGLDVLAGVSEPRHLVTSGSEETGAIESEAQPNPEEATPTSRVDQIVLHRCVAWTIQDCLRRLLLKESLTHFVIGIDGKTIQVSDVSHAVRHHEAIRSNQVSIHFLLPPMDAPYFQNPDDPTTWRHPRTRKINVEINGVFQSGWGLTQSQHQSLVPLLHALITHFSHIQPAFPINMKRHETFAALLEPHKHQGILSHSNLSASVATCPGPGIDLGALAAAVPTGHGRAPSLDLEPWVGDLTVPGKREGAMARLAAIGDLAVPILSEVVREAPAPLAIRAMDALALVGHATGGDVLAAQLAIGWDQKAPDLLGEQKRWRSCIHGLARTGTPQHVEAVVRFIQRIVAADTAEQTHTWQPLLASSVAVLLNLAEEPSHVASAVPLLTYSDARVRAQAFLALSKHDPATAKTQAATLIRDENSWIRLLAARAMGADGVDVFHSIRHTVEMDSVLQGLAHVASDKAHSRTLSWYNDSESHEYDREALRRMYVHWKWPKAVPVLARHLSKAKGTERNLTLHALRTITGRDFGSSAEGWLRWRPTDQTQ